MATDTSIAGIATTATSTASAHKTANTLDVEDFLTLMTTQLKNQDPLKPLDSTEFVAQLAQFGTVSGIQGMQSSLDTLSQSLRASQALSGASLVGHWVLTPADSANFNGSRALGGAVNVPAGTSSVVVNISDSSGQVVRHIGLGNTAGQQEFAWDGTADDGSTLPAGSYKFQAVAAVGGGSESLEMQIYGQVGSVSIDAAGTGLTVNTPELGALALGAVRQII